MSFTGSEDHSISLAEAAELTSNYRATLSSSADVIGEYFGKEALISLLNQTNCVGARVYYGLDDNGVKKLVLVGVDTDGNDLYENKLMERGLNCPPYCSTSNPLNSQ